MFEKYVSKNIYCFVSPLNSVQSVLYSIVNNFKVYLGELRGDIGTIFLVLWGGGRMKIISYSELTINIQNRFE